MEITFTAHVKQPKVVELDSVDLKSIQEMATASLLQHLEYGSFNYSPFESRKPQTLDQLLVQMCLKYDVDPYNKEDRVSFYKAVLSPASDETSKLDCN